MNGVARWRRMTTLREIKHAAAGGRIIRGPALVAAAAACCAALCLTLGCSRSAPQRGREGGAAPQAGGQSEGREEPAAPLAPVKIELPAPAFRGTPVPLKEPYVEKPLGRPRPPFLAPLGTVNLAAGRPVRASDLKPLGGELDYVNDGRKEALDFQLLHLHPGTQWVQIDLGRPAAIYGLVVWHNHADARVYRDVVVQISDDPDFLTAETVFNNDYDNTSGLGVGRDLGYVETSEGKLIDCGGAVGRYVRLYSRGNHLDDANHYTEVEVYGRPAT